MMQRTIVEEPMTVLPPTCLSFYITSDIEEHISEKKKMMAWG